MNGLIEDKRISATGFVTDDAAHQRTEKHSGGRDCWECGSGGIICPAQRFQLREDQATNGITPADKQAKRDDGKHRRMPAAIR